MCFLVIVWACPVILINRETAVLLCMCMLGVVVCLRNLNLQYSKARNVLGKYRVMYANNFALSIVAAKCCSCISRTLNYFPAAASWSTWSSWSACSATCQGGIRVRRRSCQNGNTCPGSSVAYQYCNYRISCTQQRKCIIEFVYLMIPYLDKLYSV